MTTTASTPVVPSAETAPAASPAPSAGRPTPPSVHVRAVITWLAIFPLVSIGMIALAPISVDWHPVLRAFVLTLIVVPLAVYLVVPQLMRTHTAIRAARAARATRRGDA
jgi:antibiotic biosynthesis monooxygenase (ABM) superfamily enzyme